MLDIARHFVCKNPFFVHVFLIFIGDQDDMEKIVQARRSIQRTSRNGSHSTETEIQEEWTLREVSNKAIGRKEYTKLRRIFVRIQGARQAHRSLCNCYCNAEAGR